MYAKGKSALKVAGILEIILGVAGIALILWIMSLDDNELLKSSGFSENGEFVWPLILAYVTSGFSILAGVIGVIFANKPKHWLVCTVCGLILLAFAASGFTYGDMSVSKVIQQGIQLLIPVYYLLGALRNRSVYTGL